MIIKWLQSIVRVREISKTPLEEGGAKAGLIDLAHQVLSETILGERLGRRRQLQQKVKKQVSLSFSDEELVEEVTEKITEVAEVDPYYSRLFENPLKKK